MMKARKIVDEMDSYVPGRSQGEIAEEFGLNKDEIIKLGSNENPWGPSPKAMEAIKDEIKSINRYPESQLKELVAEIAKYADVEDNQVIITMNTCSSSTELILYMQDGIWIKTNLTWIQYLMQ